MAYRFKKFQSKNADVAQVQQNIEDLVNDLNTLPKTFVKYRDNSGQTLPGATTQLSWNTKETDVLGEVSYPSGKWTFRPKNDGLYTFNLQILYVSSTWAAGTYSYIAIFKNGVNTSATFRDVSTGGSSINVNTTFNETLKLNSGDVITFFNEHNHASINMYAGLSYNWITVVAV